MNLCVLSSSYPARSGESNNAGVFVRDFACACNSVLPGCTVFTHRKDAPGVYQDGIAVTEYGWLGRDSSLTSIDLGSARGFINSASLLINGAVAYLRHCQRSGVSHSLAMWAFPSGIFSYLAKKRYGTPYSIWVLGSDFWRYEKHALMAPVLRRILRNADYCFADGIRFAEQVSEFCGRQCTFLPSTRNLPWTITGNIWELRCVQLSQQ
jgi:hypothetical protein